MNDTVKKILKIIGLIIVGIIVIYGIAILYGFSNFSKSIADESTKSNSAVGLFGFLFGGSIHIIFKSLLYGVIFVTLFTVIIFLSFRKKPLNIETSLYGQKIVLDKWSKVKKAYIPSSKVFNERIMSKNEVALIFENKDEDILYTYTCVRTNYKSVDEYINKIKNSEINIYKNIEFSKKTFYMYEWNIMHADLNDSNGAYVTHYFRMKNNHMYLIKFIGVRGQFEQNKEFEEVIMNNFETEA